MAELSSLVVTEKGHTLIGKFIMNGGDGLKLTKVATSSTAYPESALASLISLTGIQQIGEISYMEKYSDTEIRFEASIENSKLTEGYNINTIGVYANDPDDGEILYAVCRALVPGYISAYDGKSVSGATFDLVVGVGGAEVNLDIDPAVVATIHDVERLKKYVATLNETLEQDVNEKISSHAESSILDHPDGSVTSEKLADNSVITDKIMNKAITNDKIALKTIDGGRIKEDTIQGKHIWENTITSREIGIRAIEETNIADDAINSNMIQESAVTAPKIALNSITGGTNVNTRSTGHIALGTVTGDNIAIGTIKSDNIANKGISTDNLADKCITTAKIADKAITGQQIETKTITNWQMNDNAIQEYAIQDGAVSNRKLSSELQSKLNNLNSANIIKNPTDSTGDIINTHLTVGDRNGIFGEHSFVSGGASGNHNALQYCGNTASERASASVGGTNNNATGVFSATLGGTGNTASGNNSACIGGGYTTNGTLRSGPNVSKAYNSVCIGGACNTIEATSITANSAIIGGLDNTVSSSRSACVGGQDNSITGPSAVVLGGNNNAALTQQTKTGHYSKNGTGGSSSSTSGDAFIIGNGTSSAQSNAIRVTYTGDVYAAKSINGTGADYAELREWIDGNPDNQDRCGLMVTLVGSKIRLAQLGDNLSRVGVISGNPCVVGNNYADAWHGKYKKDVFGRYIKELVHHDAVVDEVGNIIHEAVDTYDFIFADDFDPTKNDDYTSREERPEFDFMGTHGEIVTIDDGTCEADGYCVPGENGIATKGNSGFYVMERIDENHIRVFVR